MAGNDSESEQCRDDGRMMLHHGGREIVDN